MVQPTDERRCALVIGNADYLHEDSLRNPVRDAQGIAAALDRLGFVVEFHANVKLIAFRQIVADFTKRARNADVAVTYFSGHALEDGRNNYLLPVDANILDAGANWQEEALPVNSLKEITAVARKYTLIILDACRRHPNRDGKERPAFGFGLAKGTRSGLPGEMNFSSGSNWMIAYAAQPQATAWDGAANGYSPYADALLSHIEIPGLEVTHIFRRVLETVQRKTGGAQIPASDGNLPEVYLRYSVDEDDKLFSYTEVEVHRLQHNNVAEDQVEFVNQKTAQLYREYLQLYPSGRHADTVKRRLGAIAGDGLPSSLHAGGGTAHGARPAINARRARLCGHHMHPNHYAHITGLGFARERDRVVSGCRGKVLRVWDLQRKPRSIDMPQAVTSLAVTGSGALAYVGGDKGSVFVVDLLGEQIKETYDLHTSAVTSVLLMRDDASFLSSGKDGSVACTVVATKKSDKCENAHRDRVLAIALSPQEDTALSACRAGVVKLWRLTDASDTNGTPLAIGGSGRPVNAIDYVGQGRHAVWVSGSDGAINRFDLHLLRPDGTFGERHAAEITTIKVSHDGKWLLSGDVKGVLKLWDAESGRLVDTLQDDGPPIASLAFSASSRYAVSGDEHATVRLWDLSRS